MRNEWEHATYSPEHRAHKKKLNRVYCIIRGMHGPLSPWAVILLETKGHRLTEELLVGLKSVLSNGVCVLLTGHWEKTKPNLDCIWSPTDQSLS